MERKIIQKITSFDLKHLLTNDRIICILQHLKSYTANFTRNVLYRVKVPYKDVPGGYPIKKTLS